VRIIAVLDTYWDPKYEGRVAPRAFRISRTNHSGRMLYKLVGQDTDLLVTDACKYVVGNANRHGEPDPKWLGDNLRWLESWKYPSVILLCGKVAQRTHELSDYACKAPLLSIAHPAARDWSKDRIIKVMRTVVDLATIPPGMIQC